jgi:hypothetical protein
VTFTAATNRQHLTSTETIPHLLLGLQHALIVGGITCAAVSCETFNSPSNSDKVHEHYQLLSL